MRQRRKFSAEYKREAVAMLESPGVTREPDRRRTGDWGELLGRWRRELRQAAGAGVCGQRAIPG